ncbi:hypothetical protein Sjap_020952 [Stephania japonica]|uniref:Protein kinase domain-containing protein n=1 Tax=Stephania japonica TaxID=461633 RepID=A0AAP0F6X6_9MAGN
MNLASILAFIITAHFAVSPSSAAFAPPDNYLINCGSVETTTVDNRDFKGDSSSPGSAFLSAAGSSSIAVQNPNSYPGLSDLYRTARVFTSVSRYEFGVTKNGTHMVRLHFFAFNSQKHDLGLAQFNVSVNGYPILSGFSVDRTKNGKIKEFFVNVQDVKVVVVFTPLGRLGIAFVNAIEVISAPDELIADGAQLVGPSGPAKYGGLRSKILETLLRINVGGAKITPFNDTLWRDWIPDEEFLVAKNAAKRVSRSPPPNYKQGGATQETAPDQVYITAQVMNRTDVISSAMFNISWVFPLSPDNSRYFVRMHFCDFVSTMTNQLYFNVYINNYSAIANLDLSAVTFDSLATPYYQDFVVDSNSLKFIRVSVGPSNLSMPAKVNAILNGLEIMRIMNDDGLGSQGGSKKKRTWILVGAILGGFFFICFVALAFLLMGKCMKKEKPKQKPAESSAWSPLTVRGSSYTKVSEGTTTASLAHNLGLKISFAEIQYATNSFDKKLIIGSGGFGMVFKGVLQDGTEVAVKRGVPGSRQGLPEFQTEITVLSKIRHRHLVSLIGYCEEQSEMILVYEFMEKGTLKSHLYGTGMRPLSWKQRLEICIGSARGLHYLHTGSAQGIIHRDVKSTNILLDENYVAKVADFGLSRAGPCLDETHVSTGVKGSFGYLDPEYFKRQQLTDKSDVYSFGVVLFEVLCARPAIDPLLSREQVNLAEWAMLWQKRGMLEQIVDPFLTGKIKTDSLRKFGDTATKCLADYGVDRPTMGDVLWNLEYALQLQETGISREPHEDSSTNATEIPVPILIPRIPSTTVRIDEDNADQSSSDMSTSKVFSQLITSEGR